MHATRMKSGRILSIVPVILACMLLVPGSALAYLDPASSTFILQTIVAGIFSALYFVKLNWLRLKSFFTGGSVGEEAAKDAHFARILQSQRKFSETYRYWKRKAYLPRNF